MFVACAKLLWMDGSLGVQRKQHNRRKVPKYYRPIMCSYAKGPSTRAPLPDGEESVDGGTLALSTVAGRDVGHGELSKVHAKSLGLDLNVDEVPAVVDTDNRAL